MKWVASSGVAWALPLFHGTEGGDEKAQQCGWLKDKYGVSWQVVATVLPEMINHPDSDKSQRTMEAMLQMKKIDIDELKRAYAGTPYRLGGSR
jgi:predicted 3-demethylubiquinone-9 3-methyltransferase (glyoxalase superfamily)